MPDVSSGSLDFLGWLTNGLVIAAAVGIYAFLWSPVLRRSRVWRATVTPLASIIGSGFLVVAPLLGHAAGHWAVIAMLGIVTLAFAVGSIVRYNIRNVERISDAERTGAEAGHLFKWMERAAKIALALAYVVAITFYLELLAAFVLQLFGVEDQVSQKAIATVLIVFIGAVGFWHGLEKLESLEKYAVDAKLAIIAGFLVGLAVVNIHFVVTDSWSLASSDVVWDVETIRKLLGIFLIVQGFETCRYMGNVYSVEDRIVAMRQAQLLSAVIYVVFIGLASVLLNVVNPVSETGIIKLSAQVAVVAPYMLIIGAATAQFSAAVADTLATGGLVEAATYGKIGHRHVYLAIMAVALLLLWTSHIFEIIAYASRAFAAYYAIQCVMAATHSAMSDSGSRRIRRVVWFAFLSLVMMLTVLFGIPAESSGK